VRYTVTVPTRGNVLRTARVSSSSQRGPGAEEPLHDGRAALAAFPPAAMISRSMRRRSRSKKSGPRSRN